MAERAVADLRAETGRADTKASVLIAVIALGLGAPLGMSRPAPAGEPYATFWWLGCIFWVLAVGSLLMSLAPRYRRSSWTSGAALSSFVDVHRASRAGQLLEAIRSTELDEQAGLLANAEDLSRIVLLKYRWIRGAISCFAVGMGAVAFSLLGS